MSFTSWASGVLLGMCVCVHVRVGKTIRTDVSSVTEAEEDMRKMRGMYANRKSSTSGAGEDNVDSQGMYAHKASGNLAEWGRRWVHDGDFGFLRSMANRNHVSTKSSALLSAAGEGHGHEYRVEIRNAQQDQQEQLPPPSFRNDSYPLTLWNSVHIHIVQATKKTSSSRTKEFMYAVNGTGVQVADVALIPNIDASIFEVVKKNSSSTGGHDRFMFGDIVYLKAHNGCFLEIDPETQLLRALSPGKGQWKEFMLEDYECSRGACAHSLDLMSGPLGTREETLYTLGHLADTIYEFNGKVEINGEVDNEGKYCYEECGQGVCDFCGKAGICCRHSGIIPFYDKKLDEHGCKNKGGHFAHRCVRRFKGRVNSKESGPPGWTTMEGWVAQLGTIQDDSKNFTAQVQKAALTNPTYPGTVVIAFHGTDEEKGSTTVRQDIQIVLAGPRRAIQECVDFVTLVREQFADHHIYLTGHSLGGFFAETVASIVNLEGAVFNSPGAIGISMHNLNTGWHRPRFECHHDMNDPVARKFFPGWETSVVHTYARGDVKFKAGWGAAKRDIHMCNQHEYDDLDTGGCHGCAGPYMGLPSLCRNTSEKRLDTWCVCFREPSRCPPEATGSMLEEAHSIDPDDAGPVGLTGWSVEKRNEFQRRNERGIELMAMVMIGGMALGMACLVAACCVGAYFVNSRMSAPAIT